MLRTMFLVLLALSLGLPASAADTYLSGKAPDIDTFMQIGYAGSPELTKNGGALFFLSNSPGVTQIFRLEPAVGWPYQLTVFTEGVNFYSLSPDGKHIICGVASGGDENAQLWLLDAATGEAEQLTNRPDARYGNASWNQAADQIFYRSNEENLKDFYIYRMNLATREVAIVAEMEGWNGPGEVSPDDNYLLVGHWDSNTNSDLYLVDLDTHSRTHLTPHEGESTYSEARFSADQKTLYLLTNANSDGINRLATLSLSTKAIEFLEPSEKWETSSVVLSPNRDFLAWTRNEDGYDRLSIQRLDSGKTLAAPAIDGTIGGLSFTEDGRLGISFAGATRTSDVWMWDGQHLEQLTHSTYAGIDPGRFRKPELVHYPSFDGREIPAFLYLPPNHQDGEPVPFVVHVHGGPESQFRPVFIRHFQYLLLNGFGILAPNVRGSSGYGKDYMALDNYKKRLDSVRDLKAAADFLTDSGYSAPGMIAIKGGSYGGYMTLAGITEYPNLFSAAVDQVGIANFVTFLENTAAYRRHLREAEYGPLSDRDFLQSISPLNKASEIKTPLLVIHGENDPRVPVGEARQIAAAIEKNGGVVDLLIFPDEGHGVSKRPNVLKAYRRMVEFLDQYLNQDSESGS